MVKAILVTAALLAATAAWAAEPAPITKADLDAAPDGKVENLGIVQSQARLCGEGFVPGTEDSPPRYVISFWSMANRQLFKTYVANLATGEARLIDAPGFDKDAPRWPSVRGGDGKLFFSCMQGGLAIYDPAKDEFKYVKPMEQRCYWLRGLAIGPDGAVYVSGYPHGDAARYDIKTGEVEYYGPQGGPYQITNIYGYSVGSDGQWVYTAAGKIPWYVVACNRKTKQQKNLFKFDQADFPSVVQRGDKVYLSAWIATKPGAKRHQDVYLLSGGEATKIETLPDAPKAATTAPTIPQPVVKPIGRALNVTKDGAILLYKPAELRSNGKEPWHEIVLAGMPGEPYVVTRVAPTDDGRLVLSMGIYGDIYTFDPKTGEYTKVGNPSNRNVYCLLVVDGAIYYGGYSNAFLGMFDDKGGDHFLYDWNGLLGSKRSLSLVRGADGRIYLGNRSEREFVGGSLGWWDPKADKGKEPGGVRFPNDEANWTIGVDDGKYVVVASRGVVDPAHPEVVPPGGKIIVYSIAEQKIVKEFVPFPNDKPAGNSAGMIVEARPGVIFGVTTFQGQPMMYAAEVLTGKMLFQQALPAAAHGDLTRGPDGEIYTFLDKTLVLIDPQTFAITPVCKMTSGGRMAFIGKDLYIAGEFELRRIKNVAE